MQADRAAEAVRLALNFSVADNDLLTAETHRDLIAGAVKQLVAIVAQGNVDDACAATIERTVRLVGDFAGIPVLIDATCPAPSAKAKAALEGGERAFELSRERLVEIVDRWSPHALALGKLMMDEIEAPTATGVSYLAALAHAGIDRRQLEAEPFAELRIFARHTLGQPLSGSAPSFAPIGESKEQTNA